MYISYVHFMRYLLHLSLFKSQDLLSIRPDPKGSIIGHILSVPSRLRQLVTTLGASLLTAWSIILKLVIDIVEYSSNKISSLLATKNFSEQISVVL